MQEKPGDGIAYPRASSLGGIDLAMAVFSPVPSSGLFNASLNSLEMESLGPFPIIIIIINSTIVAAEPQAAGMQTLITSLLNAPGNG